MPGSCSMSRTLSPPMHTLKKMYLLFLLLLLFGCLAGMYACTPYTGGACGAVRGWYTPVIESHT